MTNPTTLHQGMPVLTAGAPLKQAKAAMILLHGRGASAQDILTLTQEFDHPDFVYLAPQAAGSQWYPNRFIAPLASNEPWFSSAITAVASLLAQINTAGISLEKTILLGFSQGACLALEFAARHPQRYGGVVALSGALIENGDKPRDYTGSLAGTPAFLGCSTVDFHIPAGRVERSATLLQQLSAEVTLRLYPNMGHTVSQDEIEFVQGMMQLT
ncbi:MAG: alpha/beta fold hydrolase [Chloroflexi bacterium]|nr:alpha/beta fold hydrolase [Chloroflexota bacterium]